MYTVHYTVQCYGTVTHSDNLILQLEDSHYKTCEAYESKLHNALGQLEELKTDLQRTSEQYEGECEELKAQVIEVCFFFCFLASC